MDELDSQFLEGLKAAFKAKQIEIAVSEADETERLLCSPANRDRLVKATDDVEHGRNVLVPDRSQFR